MSSIFDKAAQLDPASAGPYLRAHGWELVGSGALGERWQLREGARPRNVAVPRASVLDDGDQQSMLATLLTTLAEVEEREPGRIAQDLIAFSSDLLEFRLRARGLTGGEIPLRAAPELTQGAFEALSAAARSEVVRRAHYASGTLPSQVRSFVDGATLAGTEQGSVILQVRAPAHEESAQETFLPPAPTFERRVVSRLVDGVRAAKSAVHRDLAGGLEQLDEDVEEGLSANLCQALLSLAGENSDLHARIDLRVRWALTHPMDEPVTRVEVDRDEIGRLPEVAEILREIQPEYDRTVKGPVTNLRREPGDPAGWATIQTEVDLKVRPVRIYLPDPDYDKAIHAHESQDTVELQATGTLEHAGRSRELTNAKDVETVTRSEDPQG